jgi:hypothetical protein
LKAQQGEGDNVEDLKMPVGELLELQNWARCAGRLVIFGDIRGLLEDVRSVQSQGVVVAIKTGDNLIGHFAHPVPPEAEITVHMECRPNLKLEHETFCRSAALQALSWIAPVMPTPRDIHERAHAAAASLKREVRADEVRAATARPSAQDMVGSRELVGQWEANGGDVLASAYHYLAVGVKDRAEGYGTARLEAADLAVVLAVEEWQTARTADLAARVSSVRTQEELTRLRMERFGPPTEEIPWPQF